MAKPTKLKKTYKYPNYYDDPRVLYILTAEDANEKCQDRFERDCTPEELAKLKALGESKISSNWHDVGDEFFDEIEDRFRAQQRNANRAAVNPKMYVSGLEMGRQKWNRISPYFTTTGDAVEWLVDELGFKGKTYEAKYQELWDNLTLTHKGKLYEISFEDGAGK